MRIGFGTRPDDLYAVVALTFALLPLSWLGLGGVLGAVVGVLFVVFLPGYAGIALLFPGEGDITWVQRVTLSLGASLALVPLAGLLSNYLPGGIRIETVLAILAGVTFALAAFAHRRRQGLSPERRLRLSVEVSKPRWQGLSGTERGLALSLALALALASAALAYSASHPRGAPGFTEFYVLNDAGSPSNYPSDLQVGEEAGVLLVVVNHESVATNYTIEIRLTALAVVFNQTSGRNETVEVGNRTLGWISATISDGGRVESPFRFSVDQPGDYALKFLLYRGSPGADAYRFLRLFLHVT